MAFWNRKRARTASVEPYQAGTGRGQKKLQTPTQRRAAEFAAPGKLGVVRFASGLLADSGARCTLRVERCVSRREDAWEPDNHPYANELLTRYRGKDANQRELIRQHIWHYQTVGECVQYAHEVDGKRYYDLASPFAVDWKREYLQVMLAPGGNVRDGLAREIPREHATRLWIADEQWPALAASPLMGVIEDCERYWTLGRRLRREGDSALIGNGAVWIPSEAHTDLAREQRAPSQPGQPKTRFEQDYYAAAARAFDPDSDYVEDIAPLLWRWPKEHGPPQKIDFASDTSAATLAARAEALECIARGLNFPQRLLVSGGGDMNHWGAWLLDEQFAKNGLSPLLERVCWGDLTDTFFRRGLRALAAAGYFDGDPDEWRVGFDMTPVVAHPDAGAKALELNTAGLLKDAKTLELNGFDTNDLLSPEEFQRWTIRMQAQHASAPAMAVGPSTVLRQPPALNPATAALDVASTVLAGPYPDETASWLDA